MELHEFFMQAPVPLVLLSEASHIFTLANKAYENLVKRSVIGKTVNEIFSFEEAKHFLPAIDHVFNTGVAYTGKEIYFPLMNDNEAVSDHWVDVNYYPFFGNTGKITGVLAFINDVTAIVEARKFIEKSEQNLRHLVTNLEKESDLREVFVSALSHDLRTPLTVAKLSSQALMRKLEDSSPMHKIAHRISVSMDRADKMIQDLLDASQIKGGEKLPLRITSCNMNNIVTSVIEELSSMHHDRFEMHAEEEINGFWDDSGIRRVLENLLLNGIKYGSELTPVNIRLSRNEESIVMEVHNEGLLIIPDELATIFDRFKRAKNASLIQQKGWGLGLTLVKGIIEAHGGTVNVKSLSGEGTTFAICLPLDSTSFCDQG